MEVRLIKTVLKGGHLISTYTTGEKERVYQNGYSCVWREGMLRFMCKYPLKSLFMFLAACLSSGVLHSLQKFIFTFIPVRCFLQKLVFFSNEISVCPHEISFFYFQLPSQKVSQNGFNCSVQLSAGNKVNRACLILLLLLLLLLNVIV